MKSKWILASLLLTGLSMSAFAEQSKTRIDFNRMIDENNHERTALYKDLGNKVDNTLNGESEAERAKVVDFVDVEVGWGEGAPVVDRRFDSIGKSRPYKLNEESGS